MSEFELGAARDPGSPAPAAGTRWPVPPNRVSRRIGKRGIGIQGLERGSCKVPCSMSESNNPPPAPFFFFRSSFVARFMHREKTEAGLGGKLGPEAAAGSVGNSGGGGGWEYHTQWQSPLPVPLLRTVPWWARVRCYQC